MKVNYLILICIIMSLIACNNDAGNDIIVSEYPLEQQGEVINRNLLFSDNLNLKSGNNIAAFNNSERFLDRELDLDKLEHNYITSGYTVKVFQAWISDDSNPNGGYYDDLEFNNIDFYDYNIEFETAGPFSIEVKHPDFKEKDENYGAYYEFKETEFSDWPNNEPLIIDMELGQHAVFLVYRTLDVYFTIDWMKVERLEVTEYQPIYVQADKKFEIKIKHNNERETKKKMTAVEKGACEYYWVESILDL